MYNLNTLIPACDIVLITLDTLRYDVAQEEWEQGRLPHFSAWLPATGWEKRHTPGSFTYAAHQAFFAGFLPTPAQAPKHPRLFATRFAGSETSTETTCVFDAPTIVEGLAQKGYHTACIGGVGFFNQQTPLSRVLPSLFAEAHWNTDLGVTAPHSTQAQLELAQQILKAHSEPLFLFVNISAIHQPNCFYLEGAQEDTLATHAAALRYVDGQLPLLQHALQERPRPSFIICCADHGTTYGEDGYTGHRLAHPAVWNVPYLEVLLD